MKNTLLSIVYAILVWVLGVGVYLLSFSIPILENPEKQADLFLVIGIIPSACLGTYLFYKTGNMKPWRLALTFVVTAILLDALITVPLFVEPAGGNHMSFFKNPMFYVIVVEFYFIVEYFGKYLTQKNSK